MRVAARLGEWLVAAHPCRSRASLDGPLTELTAVPQPWQRDRSPCPNDGVLQRALDGRQKTPRQMCSTLTCESDRRPIATRCQCFRTGSRTSAGTAHIPSGDLPRGRKVDRSSEVSRANSSTRIKTIGARRPRARSQEGVKGSRVPHEIYRYDLAHAFVNERSAAHDSCLCQASLREDDGVLEAQIA